MTESRFIPRQELERLRKGSHECFISEAKKAIAEAKGKFFGESAEIEVLATFPDKAIVLVDGDRISSVSLKKRKLGTLVLGQSKDVAISSYERSTDYLEEKLQEAATGFLAGKLKETKAALQEAVSLTDSSTFFVSDSAIQAANADRPWKLLFHAKRDEIEKAAGSVESDEFEEKFEYILKHGFAGLHHDNYKELILRDFGNLASEIKGLSESVANATQVISASNNSEDDLVIRFSSFATDLDQDLRQHDRALQELLDHSSNIEDLARLYDSLASQWNSYKTAAQFVERLADQLNTNGSP